MTRVGAIPRDRAGRRLVRGSVELATERQARFGDHLCHLHVGSFGRRRVAIWDQMSQLMRLQVTLTEQALEHDQDVDEQLCLTRLEHDDAIDAVHGCQTTTHMAPRISSIENVAKPMFWSPMPYGTSSTSPWRNDPHE